MNPTLESYLVLHTRQNNVTTFQALVTGHLGMVFDMARSLAETCGKDSEFSELVSEGELALCEAARTFCEQRPSCRFSTYAHRRIRGAMIGHVRTSAPWKSTEWQARAAQAARRSYAQTAQRFVEAGMTPPSVAEYSETFGEHQGKHLTDQSRVPLELADGHPEFQVQPQEAVPFHERFAALPPPTRALIGFMVDGATMGQLAASWGTPREEIRARIIEGYQRTCD